MRDEHNFCASLSQYEAQIRRWDMPKNLKRSEWAHIIAKMDDLKSGGVESRLKLAGSLVSADKIKQKRRRYSRLMSAPSIEAKSLPGPFPWDSPRFTLEVLAQNGQWSPYRAEQASVHVPRHATLSSSIINTASRTLNPISTPSNSSTVHYSRQRSVDKDGILRPVPTISSDDALRLPWLRDNGANIESYCHSGYMEAVLNPSQDTEAGANGRNNSPRLPDYHSREIFDVLGMDGGFTLSPSSLEILLPIADVPGSPFSLPGESLTWSPSEGSVDASLLKYLEDSPFLLLEKHIQNFRATSIGQSEQSYLMFDTCYNSNSALELTRGHSGHSTTSVFREIASMASIAQAIPEFLGQERLIRNHQFNEFVDSLDSLLPDNIHEGSGYPSVFDASSLAISRLLESPFHRTILYSTINGFAGLSCFPALPLFHTYSGLFGLAKSHSSLAVRSFIDNAFSAAVWNHNAQAVDVLLRMTCGTSYAVDVNKTITSNNQIPYMPIVVALLHPYNQAGPSRVPRQQLETAGVLLKAGAASTPALRYLMSDWRCPNSTSVGFIRRLLDRGAKPEREDILHSMRHGNEDITELLLTHIRGPLRQLYFQIPLSPRRVYQPVLQQSNLPILACTALYLENSTATQIIKSVLCEWPRSEIEKEFPDTYERTMDFTLIHACLKGNKELVEFLLPLVSRVSSAALVAAIRSRQQPLIELLLKLGVNVNDMPIYLTSRSNNIPHSDHHPILHDPYAREPQSYHPHLYNPQFARARRCRCLEKDLVSDLLRGKLCTPLAQAIRSGNQSLVHELEFTLSRAEKWYLEQALTAAADVGDLDYLLMLLDRSSIMDINKIHRKRALCLAIDQNRDDFAFALLDDGLDVSGLRTQLDYTTNPIMVSPLLDAVRGRRKKLIEAVLEYEPDMSHTYYIRAAALLGDMDIVNVLLSSQAAVSLRALRTALKAGNENMLHILLDHFWRRNPLFKIEDGRVGSPGDDTISDLFLADLVKAAAYTKNDTLLVSFLEHGASVNGRAIKVAISLEDPALLEHLLAFAIRPGITLDAIVQLRNQTMLRQWLSKGAGPFTESAFLHAMRLDRQSFEILMKAFRARYPKGLKGWGGSLLKNAIRRSDSSILKELLAARMDVNSLGRFIIKRHARNSDGNDGIRSTPLGFAIYHKNGKNIDDVQMLLDAGSEPNGVASNADDDNDDFLGWKTPLLLAIETGDLNLIEVILRGGADVNLAARNGRKRTPLQRACELCSLSMVELLLSWQADINGEAAIIGGGTALQLTAIGGSIKIARLLLQNGADVCAPPAKIHGRTPLEGAAEHGRLDMLKVIWDAKFPEVISLEEAGNAIYFARENGHWACEQYIKYLVPTADISEPSKKRRGGAWRYSLPRHPLPRHSLPRHSSPRHSLPRYSFPHCYPNPRDIDTRIGDESDVDLEVNASSDDERSSGAEDSNSDDLDSDDF